MDHLLIQFLDLKLLDVLCLKKELKYIVGKKSWHHSKRDEEIKYEEVLGVIIHQFGPETWLIRQDSEINLK